MTVYELDGYLRSLSRNELDNLTSLVAANDLNELKALQVEAINSGNRAGVQFMEAARDLWCIGNFVPLFGAGENK